MKNDKINQYIERAKEMVAEMTLLEKVSQLRYHSKAIKKRGISEYNWCNERLHGETRAGNSTVFPQAIAMASTFSEEVLQNSADIIATEARAKYHEALRSGKTKRHQGLTCWSPNINIFRDPRWGRGQETYGECPTLAAKLGVAFIKGLQGDNDEWLKVPACAKHFCAHSGPEADSHILNCVVSKKDLNETYLYAFEKAVKDGNVESVMTAYNRVNDEVCSASETLITNVLRGKWQFTGHVVSDCGALNDIIFRHKTILNPIKAVASAINNGLDLECGRLYTLLPIAVMMKYVNEAVIDKALIRLLTTRIKLGMVDNNCVYSMIPYSENASITHREYAISVAEKAVVMLKNDGVLPLKVSNNDKQLAKVALLGYNATNQLAYIGNSNGTPTCFATVYHALQSRLGEQLVYNKTIPAINEPIDNADYARGIEISQDADYVIICTGLDSSLEGEAGNVSPSTGGVIGEQGDRQSIMLPDTQAKLIEDIVALGKKVIVLNFSGGATSFDRVEDKVNAILQCWYIGAEGGIAIDRILYGEVSPSGRLPVTFYRHDEDLPNYYDYAMTDRTYRYYLGKAEYPFGYGLSYTQFKYSWAKCGWRQDNIVASVDVQNIGSMASDEVVQVYIKYPNGVDGQPKLKLVAFRRINLAKGERRKVEIELNKEDFAGYNARGEKEWFNGEYAVYLGGGQPDFSSGEFTTFKILK